MRYLASTIAVLASALTVTAAAQAADFTPEESMYDWSGFYIGGHAGYGEARFDGILDFSSLPGDVGRSERHRSRRFRRRCPCGI